MRLRALQLELIAVGIDHVTGLVLRGLQIALAQLGDRLGEECAGAKRRLTDRQVEDVRRAQPRVLVEEDVQRMADGELGEDLGRVVAG